MKYPPYAVLGALYLLTSASLAQTPDNSPSLFAPGVISGPADDLSPAFTPDGKTVYFTRGNDSGSMILVSSLVNGQWSAPTTAAFSGQWNDLEPTMAPDGSFLVFASNRPSAEGGPPIDGKFNGKVFPGLGGNLWRVERVGTGWGRPQRLPETINADTGTFSPSVSLDGSIYFMRPAKSGGQFGIYRSQYSGGTYLAAVPIAVGDDTTEDVDPAVAPDESFIVYCSRHTAQHDQRRLLIAFRKNGGWGAPVDLGDEVNEKGNNIEARLGADHVTLYFSTNTVPPLAFPLSPEQARGFLARLNTWADGRENIWYVSLAPWLKNHHD